MSGRRYTILLTQDAEDGGYTVRVPALPGCNTQGDTIEEAISNAREAIAAYLADMEAAGEPIPEELAPTQAIVVEVAA
jgi:antitoxin HicB